MPLIDPKTTAKLKTMAWYLALYEYRHTSTGWVPVLLEEEGPTRDYNQVNHAWPMFDEVATQAPPYYFGVAMSLKENGVWYTTEMQSNYGHYWG